MYLVLPKANSVSNNRSSVHLALTDNHLMVMVHHLMVMAHHLMVTALLLMVHIVTAAHHPNGVTTTAPSLKSPPAHLMYHHQTPTPDLSRLTTPPTLPHPPLTVPLHHLENQPLMAYPRTTPTSRPHHPIGSTNLLHISMAHHHHTLMVLHHHTLMVLNIMVMAAHRNTVAHNTVVHNTVVHHSSMVVHHSSVNGSMVALSSVNSSLVVHNSSSAALSSAVHSSANNTDHKDQASFLLQPSHLPPIPCSALACNHPFLARLRITTRHKDPLGLSQGLDIFIRT